MLEVAERVFATRGYQAATMDEIADRVGVTKPLIYDYFGSKEGLLAATIERIRLRLQAVLLRSWELHPTAPTRDRLHAVMLTFFEFNDDHAQAFRLLGNEGSLIGEASASVERTRQHNATSFAQALLGQPGFADVDALRLTAMAEIFIGGCERLAVWRTANPGLSSHEASDLMMTTVWDGMASTGRQR